MRIVTRKLHRAFPELDAYTDDQCVQYMKNLRQRKLHFSLWLILLPFLITLAYFIVVPIGLVFSIKLMNNANLMSLNNDALFYTIILSYAVIWWIGSGVVALLSRDVIMGSQLKKIVNSQLIKTRCRTCSYSLIGQTPQNGMLVCPECGVATSMQTLGITDDDLIPPQR